MRDVSARVSPWFLLLVAVSVAGGVLAALGTREVVTYGQSVIYTVGLVLLVLGGWAVSLCLHEFGHAYVAYRNGDHTVRQKGYLTLDIRRYTDVGLSFVLPIVFLLLGAIPLPGGAVWIEHGLIRSKGARSLVSLAGPATNLLLALLITVSTLVIPMPRGLVIALSCLALFQVLAFVLNILPIPGLDGFGVIEPYLSPQARVMSNQVRPWAPFVLVALLIFVPGASAVLFTVGDALFSLIGGDALEARRGLTVLQFWR
ncbi:site-2 protease family protein [Pseudonocardia sp. TRM90224]|uniref:site-2 protease family protein n=1 Tax=Pseudonocardia sp. TRM90224 TaxID=2812678 RepID=UPI001E470D81|nr:site-2 protease family protein [Pseudonocardia sp. TRM90224]